MDKYILVTGASGGIGKATVIDLLNKGFKVVGIDIVEDTFTNDNYYFYKCDITNIDSLNEVKSKIESITNSLYAIYNIAGIFMLESIVEGNSDDLHKIVNINFFGVYNVNKVFLSLLNSNSRIIIFTSEVARYSIQPFNGYYALSKIILDNYADVLRRELNYLNIKVIKVQSGAIKTNLLAGVNGKYKETVDKSIYFKKPLTKLKHLMDNEINKEVLPNVVSKKLVKIAIAKHPHIRYKIKNSFKLEFLNSLPEKLQDVIYINVIK